MSTFGNFGINVYLSGRVTVTCTFTVQSYT